MNGTIFFGSFVVKKTIFIFFGSFYFRNKLPVRYAITALVIMRSYRSAKAPKLIIIRFRIPGA